MKKRNKTNRFVLLHLLLLLGTISLNAQEAEWWLNEPYRLVQTNLREIDATDFDMEVYVKSLQDLKKQNRNKINYYGKDY